VNLGVGDVGVGDTRQLPAGGGEGDAVVVTEPGDELTAGALRDEAPPVDDADPVARDNPHTRRIVVVLPAPLGPSNP